MKNIIFIAPPAAGKGTQSDLLVKKFGYEHISTGDLLRAEVASGSDFGKDLSEIMNSGALVSDEIVTKLLENKLSTVSEPYIFDGYPRNIAQADILANLLNKLNKGECVVIYLDVPEDEATRRATGRLSCPNCNRSYHKYNESTRPKVEWKCDDCNTDLISRDDDTEETFRKRYQTYVENTSPLLDYYQGKGMLHIIHNPVVPEITSAEIEKIIK